MSMAATESNVGLGEHRGCLSSLFGRYSAPFPQGFPGFGDIWGPSPCSPPQSRSEKTSHGLVVLKMNMELCGTIALPVLLFSFFCFFFSISSSSSLVSASFKGLASPSVLLLTAGK